MQVVQRHNGSAVVAERKGVLKVSPGGAQPPQQTGKRPGHAQFLRARGQLDRLDALRNELGVASDRGDPQVGGDVWQQAQQVQDVRLLTRPAAAEDVGIDGDEREGQATAFR